MTKNALASISLALLLLILLVIGYKFSSAKFAATELSLPPAPCNPGLTACVADIAGGGQIELRLSPHPIRPLQALTVQVLTGTIEAEHVEVDFDGTQMHMGYNRTILRGQHGAFTGQTMLPVCLTGSMEWAATVLLTVGNRRLVIPFHFVVAAR